MATYKQLQDWVRAQHGFAPKTCWIAHCKELANLPERPAVNRQHAERRLVPCPPEKRQAILSAFVHFGLLEEPEMLEALRK